MKRFPIADPETFHLRQRILDTAGIPYRKVGPLLELEQDLEKLPDAKQYLVQAALDCHLDWHNRRGLTAKEKVAIGVAAMDVDWFRTHRLSA